MTALTRAPVSTPFPAPAAATAAPEDLLAFAQTLQAAQASGIPLSRFLREAAAQMEPSLTADWAGRLADGLARGHAPADVLAGLPGLDEVLAALLGIPGGFGLHECLATYVRQLVAYARLAEHLRTALFHPFLVSVLAVANVALINLHLLPAMSAGFAAQRLPLPTMVRAWFVADPATWPVSFILPTLVVTMAGQLTLLLWVTPPRDYPATLIGRLLRLPRFAWHEEKGRLLGTLALFLQAGRPLPEALHWTARHGGARLFQDDLRQTALRLEKGEPAADALWDSELLGPIAAEVGQTGDTAQLVGRLDSLARAHLEMANGLLSRLETVGQAAGLLLLGGLVLLLCLAFFQPYFAFTGQTAVTP